MSEVAGPVIFPRCTCGHRESEHAISRTPHACRQCACSAFVPDGPDPLRYVTPDPTPAAPAGVGEVRGGRLDPAAILAAGYGTTAGVKAYPSSTADVVRDLCAALADAEAKLAAVAGLVDAARAAKGKQGEPIASIPWTDAVDLALGRPRPILDGPTR